MATGAVLLLAISGAAGASDDKSVELVVGMHLDIAADGSVTAVEPEAGLLRALHDGLVRHAMQWRYAPATWHGKPVASRQWAAVTLEPVATTSGGYAIRILGTGHKHQPGTTMPSPQFPREAMRAGVNAALLYQVHVSEDGSMTPVALLEPRVPKGHVRSLDKVSRAAIATFHRVPIVVEGAAIACEMRLPITFATTKEMPMPELDALEPLPDQCPKAKLETPIAGMML